MTSPIKNPLSILRALFAPPDPFETSLKQTETLLTVYLFSFMAIMTTGCVILIARDPSQITRPLSVIIVIDAFYFYLYRLMKKGQVRLANILAVGVTWVLLSFAVFTGGGIHSPAFSGYLMLTFLAGITLGTRAMVVVAVTSTITGFGMELLEVNGYLPPAAYQASHFGFLILQSIVLLIIVILQYYASSLVKKSFKTAQDQLKERILAEEALSASQRHFAAIFENSPIATALTALTTGQLLNVNPMWVTLTGFKKEEVIGGNVLDLGIWLRPEDRSQMVELLKTQDHVQDFETFLLRKDGMIRNISVSASKINLNGSDCLIFQSLDITEKRTLERSLLESNERFDQIARHIPEVFWVSESMGGLSYVSPAYASIYGRAVEEAYTDKQTYIELVHPEDRLMVSESFKKQRQGEATQTEYRILRPDGTSRWIYDRSFPVFDPNGQLLQVIGVAADITEQKLAEAERYELTSVLKDAEQQVGLASWSQDLVTGKGRWSPHMFTLFGFDPAGEIPSMSDYLDRIHPEDRNILGDALSKMMQGEETAAPFIYRTNPQYGEVRVLKPTYRIEKDTKGQIIKFYGTVLDITERKRAETELEHRQSILEKVIQVGKIVTSITDLDNCLQAIHQTITKSLGFERVGLFLYDSEKNAVQGVYGSDQNGNLVLNDWFFEEIQEQSDWHIALQDPAGIAATNDYGKTYNIPPGNEMYGVKQHIILAAWAGDTPVALIAVDNLLSNKPITSIDVEALQLFAGYAGLAISNARMHSGLETLVEERTNALSQSQKSLQIFLDTANDLIQSLDEDGSYIYVNQSWCRTLGYTSEEAEKLNMFQIIDKEYQEHCSNTFKSLMTDGKPQMIEVGFRTRENKMVIVEGNINVQMRNNGKRITNGFFRDVTERKQAETAMRQANLEMGRALRMKDEFMANMSHELRTPLNAVLGLSESLLEETIGSLNPRQEKYLRTISENGKHLLELINDILDLAKIESGQIHLEFTDVNIRYICKASTHIVEQLAHKKFQTIKIHVAHEVNTVLADARRLKQMIVNLLSNAVKFTPNHGKIGINVTKDHTDTNIYIEIWDTGIGIREKDMGRLFQPFVQLDGGLSRESSGTGLGLALVSQMARLHGGKIMVDSEFGKGSRFTIILPVTQISKDISNDMSVDIET